MLQNDGEPACQRQTYNALKDKKHLTGINKEERVKKGAAASTYKFGDQSALRAVDFRLEERITGILGDGSYILIQ